jgi:F-type H+-transporting ATPase subunit epsilon
LEVVTPTKLVLAADVEMVVARGAEGELGILPQHAPLVTPLDVGTLRVKAGGKWEELAVAGGYLEVLPTRVTVLANAAERATEIDVARAREARERAEARKTGRGPYGEEVDMARAEAALKRAVTRLRVAGERHETLG